MHLVPWNVDEVNKWKATKCRMFLLYLGPIVLKKIINNRCLLVSITLLLTPNISDRLLTFCQQLLEYFIKQFIEIYRKQFISHNAYALEHLCDDFRNFVPLDNCSSFPFKNYMSTLKKIVKKSHQPLQQEVKRYNEFTAYGKNNATIFDSNTSFIFKNLHNEDPLLKSLTHTNFSQYKTSKFKNIKIRTNNGKDCYVQICQNNNTIVIKVINIIKINDDNVNLVRQQLKNATHFYDKPLLSSKIGILLVNNSFNNDLVEFSIKKLICKFM